MTRRMSCSLTTDAVRARTKTVTRRHVDTWERLKPGDRLTLVEKVMGLKKGERQVVLAEVEVVSARCEWLSHVTAEECTAEGFPGMSPAEFIGFWLRSHNLTAHGVGFGGPDFMVRRIEWRYLP